MDIHVGDVLELKKEHPCGSRRWLVLRVGMDGLPPAGRVEELSAPGDGGVLPQRLHLLRHV